MIGILALMNFGAWIAAALLFRHSPALLAAAALAYTFGLRHALDADHIAAIDNVTRALMQEGRRPSFVGFFFALGHSTVVLALTAAVVTASGPLQARFGHWQALGGVVGTLISAAFLALIAAANLRILVATVGAYRQGHAPSAAPTALAGGPIGCLVRPLARLTTRSWQMYPLGVLFGLGFDTATEIALLGIAACQASQGVPPWSILAFPALFTAGMTLIDSLDGLLMCSAYGWALVAPRRAQLYNMVMTSLSVAVALVVGAIEVAGLVADHGALHGRILEWAGRANDHSGAIGGSIVALFLLVWCWSAFSARRRRLRTALSS